MILKNKINFSGYILLVMLFYSCQFEQKTEIKNVNEQIQIEIVPQKKVIIQKEGSYILDQNWDKNLQDSLLKFDTNYQLLPSSQNEYYFVTYVNDTIIVKFQKVNKLNPIIKFNGVDGPTLKSFEIQKKKQTNDFLDSSNTNIKPSAKPQKLISHTIPHPIVNIERIDPIQYHSINYIFNREIVTGKSTIISKPYPFIKDYTSLEIHFDNDFWDYTDYYYTNGIYIAYTHKAFANNPINNILISNGKNGYDYYGIRLEQKMYTGLKPKVDSIIPGDRPWSAYISIGQFLKSFDHENKLVHESELNIGIIGPKSGGGFLQDLVHTILPNNSPPLGWDNQIKTDYIIDYKYQLKKLLFEHEHIESYFKTSLQVGSLRDNLKWGFGLRYGRFVPFYLNLNNQILEHKNQKFLFNIFADAETQLIGYDATLQGGVTDRTSIYVIPTKDMERFVIQGYIGAEISYRKISLQFIQFWKSKEFNTGKDHKYVSTRLLIGI